jgi:catechol 2,3-dioxygenase-like lactoylglutathione lyase family enzyme
MEINGIAHIFLTAANFERAREFYRKLLPFLGLKPVIDSEGVYYCVGGRTALTIRAPSPENAGAAFDQNRIGLHHLLPRPRARRCRRVARFSHLDQHQNHPGAARGFLGAGLLLVGSRILMASGSSSTMCRGRDC